MKKIPENTALLLIDVQKAFDEPSWGRRNNPQAEERMAELLAVWRKINWPVIHVQHLSANPHSSLRPGQTGCEFKEIVQPLPTELVITKNVNSAFIGTNLEAVLREKEITALVIVGLTTPHCVSTTTRMAGNLGFETFLVSDATAAFDLHGHDKKLHLAEDVHDSALVSLHNEFATVIETKDLFKNLLLRI